jgi:hypothetical protein
MHTLARSLYPQKVPVVFRKQVETTVFRYKEIVDMFLSKYSLYRNNIIFSMYRTQYTSNLLVAEYYGLRNPTGTFWGSTYLASYRYF